MSEKDGGPAFPFSAEPHIHAGCAGMSLRDYFAAKGMQGLISSLSFPNEDIVAAKAYIYADAMLKERAK